MKIEGQMENKKQQKTKITTTKYQVYGPNIILIKYSKLVLVISHQEPRPLFLLKTNYYR